MKCLQTAAATAALLNRFGIKSRLWVGALCAAEVFEDGTATWGGFWGQDHHVWLTTEFSELVDLSITQLHRHPKSRRSDGIPIPAIWWNDLGRWPPVLRYMPDSPISIGLEGPDRTDLEAFKSRVKEALEAEVARKNVSDIGFGPILENVGTMDLLHDRNDWLTRAILFQDRNIPFPAWIGRRERELTEAYEKGQLAPSALSQRSDLIRGI